jgi:phage-related minor tail protein
MTEERRVQLVAEVDTTRTKQGFNEIGQQAESMATKVKAAGDRAQKGVDNIGGGAERSAAQVDRAQRSIANAIQRTTVAMESGSRTSAAYYEALAQQRGVDPQKLTPYLSQLRAIEAQQKNVGVSAAQTAAALRGVPAQLTDIVTSLQGGQQPLTVFLQQGGQLRDMFGSAGAAAKALGQTVAGLINPFTVTAAALVAIGVAYNQGSKEADEFNKSLVKSGNVAGTTTAQLTDMAASIRATGAATQGAATESLAALAGTGKVARDNLEAFAVTAIKTNKYLDQSIQDTAKNFADLGKSPVKASEQLNESLNYLTSSVYAQIKALEELGKTNEAAEVAQKAYASALDERADKIKGQLGTIEKAWQGVTGFAKKAWDAMLDVGRDDTPEDKLKKVQEQIAKLQANRFGFIGAGEARERLPSLKAEEASIERQIALQKTIAGLDAEKARFNAADIAWMKAGEEFLTKKEKLEREIAKTRQQGLDAGISDSDIEARVAKVREKFTEKGNSEAKAAFNDLINSQIEAIKRRGDVEDTVAQRSTDALEANRAAGLVTEREYIEAVAQLQEAGFVREKTRLEAELALTKQKGNSEKDQAALRGQISAVEEKAITRRLKAQNDLAVLEAKEVRDSIVASAARTEKLQAGNAALEKQIEAQQQANAQIGMSKTQIADQNHALAEEAATRKEVAASILETTAGREKEAEELRKQAKLLRESARVARDGLLKAEDYEKQRAFWTSVEDVAHQTFISIADGGKSAAQRLKDTFKNIFFDWLYQMTVKKWIVNISGQSSGFSFFGNSPSAGPGAQSAFGNVTNLLSIGKTIYNGFAGGIASSLSGIVTSLGNTFGSQAVSAFGTGMRLTSSQAAAASGAFSSAGNTTAGGGISAGSSAASVISAAGWIAAGMAIADGLFKSGFNNPSTVQKKDMVHPLVGESLLGNKLLQAIGLSSRTANILSGASVVTALFGRKSPVIESQGIRGTITTGGFSGEDFANVLQKGGLFRSDKRSVKTSPITGERDASLDSFVTGAVESVRALGKALGAEASVIDGYSKQINLTLGKDEAENKAAIEKAFGGIADDLANLLVPNLAQFSIEGETAATTLQRVATEFQLVGASLEAIGANVDNAFGAIGVASLAARERLITLAGGIEALVSQTDFFSQNFLTDEQRIAPIQKQVNEALAALGQSSLKTTAQFSEAVLGLTNSGALATEAGAKLYAGLLAIAPQFKAVADYAEQAGRAASEFAKQLAEQRSALEGRIFDLSHTPGEALARQRQAELAAMDASLRPLQERIYLLQDEKTAAEAARSAAQSAFGNLQDAIGRERQKVIDRFSPLVNAFSNSINSIGQSIDRTRSIIKLARDTFNSFALSGDEAASRARARQRLSNMARGGGMLDEDEVRQAIADATQFNESDFSSAFEFEKAVAQTRNDLLSIGDRAEKQLDGQQQTLLLIQSWKAEQEAAQAKELGVLDRQLESAQAQIDAINGVNTSVLTVRDALSAFSSAVSAARGVGATPVSNVGGAGSRPIVPVTGGILTGAIPSGGNDYMTRFWEGTSLDAFRNGLIKTEARVAPERVASAMAPISAVAGLEKRMESLETVMTTSMANLVTASQSTAATLEQFNLQGMPGERT